VLLARGDNDSRVAKDQSDRMAEALRAQGRHVPYLELEREGHLWNNWREETRMEFCRALENFLGLHLGSLVEAPTLLQLQ
jgi:dipeptidyl aminopeptidase/acylaminoacyl peptidase